MTNPIEYIDKKKLLEWLDTKANAQHFGAVYATLDEVFKEVKSGTFDDHTAQEAIAKLKNANTILMRGNESMKDSAERWEARAIQVEKERDEALRFLALTEPEADRQDEIISALLEGLKKIGGITLDGGITLLPHQALNSIHGITSSTIADLEGRKSE